LGFDTTNATGICDDDDDNDDDDANARYHLGIKLN
jgi:hypothetical protein